ncbi:MAG: response regulator [Armatimonadetes bacterium]|nr:response regulator [Armatimonadota bacterium]
MLSRGNILVVDDEVNLCRILDAKLTKSGYEVMTVHDGQQAVEKVQERQFDLVLLDLILPKLDGLEALEKIRKINSEVPVIVMTACENTDAESRARSRGASAFISKPFDLDRLVMLVQNTSTEARSISAQSTVVDGSGLFRPGQKLTLAISEDATHTYQARLVKRVDSRLNVELSEPEDAATLKSQGQVEARIGAMDAMYRFTSAVEATQQDRELVLHLPQVMYRIQRRKYPRVGVKAPVRFQGESDSAVRDGYTEDVGVGGMSIIAGAPVEPGQVLHVESSAILHLDSIKCAGQVLRCTRQDSSSREEWKLALQFTDPDPNLRRALLQHLALAG